MLASGASGARTAAQATAGPAATVASDTREKSRSPPRGRCVRAEGDRGGLSGSGAPGPSHVNAAARGQSLKNPPPEGAPLRGQ